MTKNLYFVIFTFILSMIDFGYCHAEADNVSEFIQFEGHTDSVQFAAFSPDSKTAAIVSGNTVQFWDRETLLQHIEGHVRMLGKTPDAEELTLKVTEMRKAFNDKLLNKETQTAKPSK
jgi:WD40 repeat protein